MPMAVRIRKRARHRAPISDLHLRIPPFAPSRWRRWREQLIQPPHLLHHRVQRQLYLRAVDSRLRPRRHRLHPLRRRNSRVSRQAKPHQIPSPSPVASGKDLMFQTSSA